MKKSLKAEESRAINRQKKLLKEALENNLRQKILSIIESAEIISAKEIAETMEIEQTATYQHLNILIRVGLIEKDMAGKKFFYYLSEKNIDEVEKFLKNEI